MLSLIALYPFYINLKLLKKRTLEVSKKDPFLDFSTKKFSFSSVFSDPKNLVKGGVPVYMSQILHLILKDDP